MILAALLINPVVIYFVFPGVFYDFMLRMDRHKAGFEKKMIKVKDHDISYLEGGKGETILFVHGFRDGYELLAR